MKQNNRLYNTFGPTGSFAGIIIFLIGFAMLYYDWKSIFMILIGAFIAFTYSSCIIDFNNKRVRLSTNLFGIISTGTWVTINNMSVGFKKSDKSWRSYSRSNRINDFAYNDYIVYLFSSNKSIIPLKRVKSIDKAKETVIEFSKKLELSIR